jgi:hypothetical protein
MVLRVPFAGDFVRGLDAIVRQGLPRTPLR